MSWFFRRKDDGAGRKKVVIAEGLWIKCDACKEIVYRAEVDRAGRVCPKCQSPFRIGARERIAMLVDDGSFQERDAGLRSVDPLGFKDTVKYPERLKQARARTGLQEAVIAGTVGRLRHSLTHSDDKPIAAWFDRHARYADWEAALRTDGRMVDLIRRESGARRWLKAWFGVVPARPLLVFLYGYVWRLGFLDGSPGFQHALARAFYYWQIGLKIADARRRAGPPASTDD